MTIEAVEKFFGMVDQILPGWREDEIHGWPVRLPNGYAKGNISISEMIEKIQVIRFDTQLFAFQSRNDGPYFWIGQNATEYHLGGWERYSHWIKSNPTRIYSELTIDGQTGEIVSLWTPQVAEFVQLLEKLPNKGLAHRAKCFFCASEKYK